MHSYINKVKSQHLHKDVTSVIVFASQNCYILEILTACDAAVTSKSIAFNWTEPQTFLATDDCWFIVDCINRVNLTHISVLYWKKKMLHVKMFTAIAMCLGYCSDKSSRMRKKENSFHLG